MDDQKQPASLVLAYHEVDNYFGIPGLADDSFFSQGVLLPGPDGDLWRLAEVCGDQLIFAPAVKSITNRVAARSNVEFFRADFIEPKDD